MDTVSVWLMIAGLTAGSLVTRSSFILLMSDFVPPPAIQRGLRFVPVAIFVSLIVPELLVVAGEIQVSASNPKLVGGIAAMAVAWYTRNTLLTTLCGMLVLHLVRQFG